MLGRGVQWKIGLAFAGLAFALFAAVGWLSGQQARAEVEARSADALEQLARHIAADLDVGMFERWREVRNLAAVGVDGSDPLDVQRWRELVDRAQTSFRAYSWIGAVDSGGKVLAATGGLLQGADVKSRGWFARGLSAPFVGDVHDAVLLARLLPPEAEGEPLRLVDFAAPIVRDGRTLGVLGSHLNWRWADQRRRLALAGSADRRLEVLVLGADGRVLLGAATPAPPARSALQAGAARFIAWGDDRSYLTATAASGGHQDYPGLGWTVLVRQPEDTAMAGAQALEQRIWGFGLLGAMIFGVLGFILAGGLTTRLRAVARQAQSLSGASGPRGDEVDQLAASLDQLAERIAAREQALSALESDLESRVSARTVLLERLNDDLRSFSRNVSHDLRGPIGSIGLLLRQTLQNADEPIGARTRQVLLMVAGECDRLGGLVDNLLSLAMVEEHRLEPSRVAMGSLADTVVDELTRGRQLAARVRVAPLPDVQGDPVLLRQVWHNLLSNAFKFSARATTPRIEVGAERRDGEVVFSVRDNGAGFDMSQAPRLFGVFQRLHHASDFAGTGVGLSIVKRIVMRHGGRVWAQSAPGAGATFFFALPRLLPDQ